MEPHLFLLGIRAPSGQTDTITAMGACDGTRGSMDPHELPTKVLRLDTCREAVDVKVYTLSWTRVLHD